MKKKKKSFGRKKNKKKEIMKIIYAASFTLAEILTTILLNHFMK